MFIKFEKLIFYSYLEKTFYYEKFYWFINLLIYDSENMIHCITAEIYNAI